MTNMLKLKEIPANLAQVFVKDALRLRQWIAEDTREHEGALFWKSNGAPVPLHSFREAFVEPPAAQSQACEKSAARAIAAYRKARKKISPEQLAEERAEARAAFGPGETVVNVLTGESYRT